MKRMATRKRLTALAGAALLAVLAFSGAAWAATTLAVTKTVPATNATEVSRTANLKAYFNHDMRASTVTSSTFKIRKQGTTTWLGASRSVDNTISPTLRNGSSQSVATLNPNADLAANTTYQVVVVGGSSGVKDKNGNTMGANKSWTFTTVTPPETTIDPNTGPTGTVASTSASFSFSSSEANSTFRCSLDGSAFAPCASPEDYPGPLSQVNHTFRVRAIDPTGTQDPTPASRTWTVDTTAPTVGSVSPADGATGVSPTSNVTATFSEAMNASTLSGQSLTLSKDGSSVSAQVSYDQNSRTATLDPAGDLQAGATYDAKITTSVKDSAGNALAQEKTWSFKVEPATVAGVTIAPNPLDLSPTDPLFCSPRQEYLTVTNKTPDNVTFAAVTITGNDATYFSSGSQSYLATNGPFTVLAGNYFQDQVTFRPGSTPTDLNRNYKATLTYEDGAGATIGSPVSLTANVGCLVFP